MNDDNLLDYQSLVLEISKMLEEYEKTEYKIFSRSQLMDDHSDKWRAHQDADNLFYTNDKMVKYYKKLYDATKQLKYNNKKLIDLSIYPYLSFETIGFPVIAESRPPINRFQNAIYSIYDTNIALYQNNVYYILSCFRAIIDVLIENMREMGLVGYSWYYYCNPIEYH